MCSGWYLLIGIFLAPILLSLLIVCYALYRDWKHPGYAQWTHEQYEHWMNQRKA